MYEKDRIIYELEEKPSRLQQEKYDAKSRLRIAFDENVNLFFSLISSNLLRHFWIF